MNNLTEREKLFKNETEKFIEYDKKLLDQFFNYWSEPNRSKTKMRWELQKTWDIKRRLKTFFDNQIKWNGNSKSKQQGQANAIVKLIETGKAEFAALRKEDT